MFLAELEENHVLHGQLGSYLADCPTHGWPELNCQLLQAFVDGDQSWTCIDQLADVLFLIKVSGRVPRCFEKQKVFQA